MKTFLYLGENMTKLGLGLKFHVIRAQHKCVVVKVHVVNL